MAADNPAFKKQEENLRYAYVWLARAQKDFNTFKKLVKFNKDTQKIIPCNDPALAVYLLQQSIEKAAKAVAAATGRYPYSKLKKHGHNSLVMLLDFYQEALSDMLSRKGMSDFSETMGFDFKNGLDKILSFKIAAGKKPNERQKGEDLFSEQFAAVSAIEIDGIIDLLLLIREVVFLGIPGTIFGPHSKVEIEGDRLDTSRAESFVASSLREAGKQLNVPELSPNHLEALTNLVQMYGIDALKQENTAGKKYTIDRDNKEQLAQWSLIALMFLTALTFSHESTSRYPGPPGRKSTRVPLGCEDYDLNHGLASRLGRLGYITTLVLDEIKPELKTVSEFFHSSVGK